VCPLAEALPSNAALSMLHMKHNRIGDAGACALADALKVKLSLTNLQVRGNDFGAEGIAALMSSDTNGARVDY
jgi:Leucine Rich repeat